MVTQVVTPLEILTADELPGKGKSEYSHLPIRTTVERSASG